MRPEPKVSNPGPLWGYYVIAFLEKYLPGFIFRWLLGAGTFIGWLVMPTQCRHSRDYLRQVTGRKPGISLQYRHFRAFMDSLVLKLQAGRGKLPEICFAGNAHEESFVALCNSPDPVLFGTFHVGYSDMIGGMLKTFDRRISMVRLRVGNSMDTKVLEKAFDGYVNFLWINDPAEFIFALKDAVQSGSSIALQCDRVTAGSKLGNFDFLGARRIFPMTIYHLAELFRMPVVFAFTGPFTPGQPLEVYTSPVYWPGNNREENRENAKHHFQAVLKRLECHLQNHPELWFNFLPLNEEVHDENN